ncbi:poly [ADP-ribose] polymerase tankyrase-1-like [Nasonia vitripennis]|uniref:Uncharacterized protein n=1 Tax=Nasonia vitripennis TaxID=7425 RepID=A0A7M7PWM2_NASVI|nr:poly [ADP-ribose] polymerase tankyrase-1-like [Nasonia vitripennis]
MCDCKCNFNTLLHSAVINYDGDISYIKLLLKHNKNDINVGNLAGETPLHLAVRRDTFISKPLAKLLLQHGANANVANINGDTALHILALASSDQFSKEVIKILLQHGADINAVNLKGNTPLHTVSQNKEIFYHYRVSAFLLRYGANVNVANVDGDTPLHLATRSVERYLSAKLIELLIEHGADVGMINAKGYTPYDLLFGENELAGTFEYISVFVKKSRRVNVCNAKGETPLHLSVRKRSYCNVTLIKLLLDYEADVSKEDAAGENVYQAYCKAVKEGNNRKRDPMLEILLRSEEQKHMNSSLHVASLFHSVDSVRKMLNAGDDVNAIDANGYSPLLYSLVTHGDNAEKITAKCSTIRLLLDYGADINHRFALFHVPMFPYYSRPEGSIMGIIHFGIQGMHAKDTLSSREPLFQHLAKLLTLRDKLAEQGLDVEVLSQKNSYFFDFLEGMSRLVKKYSDWRTRCTEELNVMSQTKIGESKVTFLNFLLAKEKMTALCVKNKVMIQAFHVQKSMFLMYQGMLEAKLSKAIERQKLIDRAAVAFSDGIRFADPTDAFFEKTLSYCSNKDLMNLIEGMGGPDDES